MIFVGAFQVNCCMFYFFMAELKFISFNTATRIRENVLINCHYIVLHTKNMVSIHFSEGVSCPRHEKGKKTKTSYARLP